MIKSFDQLVEKVKSSKKRTISVAFAQDQDVLLAIKYAREQGLADAILIGDEKQIRGLSEKIGLNLSSIRIIDEKDEKKAVSMAVQLVREKKAEVLMKGLCSTATLLKAVLNNETGLRSSNLLSHLAIFQIPTYHKLIFMSDAAMNIAPNLDEKVQIIGNAVDIARKFGIEKPKVAVIAAVEKVNYEKMPVTVEAAILSKMAERHQISNAIIDGPLAVDNAFSRKSCEIKGIDSPVGGDADIAIVPDIEAGNVFYKVMSYLAGAKTAGLIVGAKAPIVLTSRADSDESKYLSIATACYVSEL